MKTVKPAPAPRPEKQFTVGRVRSEVGKTSTLVTCECGHVQRVYIWSWAGHGMAVCKGCGGKWPYRLVDWSKK